MKEFWEILKKLNKTNMIESVKNESSKKEKDYFVKIEEKPNNIVNEKVITKKEENEYKFPTLDLLDTKENFGYIENEKELEKSVQNLQKKLHSFGIKAEVKNVSTGPTIITYEIRLGEGVSVNKLKRIKNDLALSLGKIITNIRIIPQKQMVGLEIERKNKEIVNLKEIIESEDFKNSKSTLTIGLGKDNSGKYGITDIKKTSHILISGTTGAGKSMFLHSIINSILYKAKPSEVKFIMVDINAIELTLYNKIPHLLIPVITNENRVLGALAWIYEEMQKRYKIFNKNQIKNIEKYNHKEENVEKFPYILFIIDGYEDLLQTNKKEVEEFIELLTKKAGKVGIYLIISTKRPSTNIISGAIKFNISTRVTFKLPAQIDSKSILDTIGAEKLFGNGDMLFKQFDTYEPIRYQGVYISENELKNITDYIQIKEEICERNDLNINKELRDINEIDTLLWEAAELVAETGQASTAFLQRRLKIGYARAGRLIDQLEEKGIISGYKGSSSRMVLFSLDRLRELKDSENIE